MLFFLMALCTYSPLTYASHASPPLLSSNSNVLRGLPAQHNELISRYGYVYTFEMNVTPIMNEEGRQLSSSQLAHTYRHITPGSLEDGVGFVPDPGFDEHYQLGVSGQNLALGIAVWGTRYDEDRGWVSKIVIPAE